MPPIVLGKLLLASGKIQVKNGRFMEAFGHFFMIIPNILRIYRRSASIGRTNRLSVPATHPIPATCLLALIMPIADAPQG